MLSLLVLFLHAAVSVSLDTNIWIGFFCNREICRTCSLLQLVYRLFIFFVLLDSWPLFYALAVSFGSF